MRNLREDSSTRLGPRGFSMIELLVSISIISVLMALVLPAINNARGSARRIQCANRLRNITVAMCSYADTNRRYPASGYWKRDSSGSTFPNHNWVVDLLAFVDRRDLADRWDKDRPLADNSQLAQIQIPVLRCPADITANGQGDLSYAVNGGIGFTMRVGAVHDCPVDPFGNLLDLDGNGMAGILPETAAGDRVFFKRLGLFFMENWQTPNGVVRHHSPNSVSDGLSNTVMILESVRTGYDPVEPSASWATADPRRAAVYFSHRICPSGTCSVSDVDYSMANSGNHGINEALTQAEGEAPWASSFHSGGTNVAFADGRVQYLDERVDGRVYASLFSAQGRSLIGTPLNQGVVSDDEF